MIPGVLDPAFFGWDAQTVSNMPMEEYGVRVLAKICEAALAQAGNDKSMLINYRQLPTAGWPSLMKHWNAHFSPEETARMFAASKMNAKNPVLPFEDDTKEKNERAPEEVRDLARQWLAKVYQQLEAERLRAND